VVADRDNQPRALIIGLDGVPYTLLMDYLAAGYMPELQRILSGGKLALRQMDASIPDVSSTSWSSFMTGVNPAEHGIFGFLELEPNSYQLYFPNFNDVKAPTIWEILGKTTNGKDSSLNKKFADRVSQSFRSIVLNIPQTYPASQMNGILTAGFVCPDLRKGTYPESAYDYLTSMGYVSDVDASKVLSAKKEFIQDLFQALEKRAVSYEHFMKNEQWDLFIGVITETDRLHHFFFEAAKNPDHPDNHFFIEFYKVVDSLIGRLYDLFMEITSGEGMFMTLSDHGFTAIKSEVYLNSILQNEGLLKINSDKQYFEKIDFGSKAFAMDPGRIYLNYEGKYPGGGVKHSEREDLIISLKETLTNIVDKDGERVIRTIHENADIYDGVLADKGPDLVCVANDGFDLKGTLSKNEAFGRTHFTGMHTSYDAHCILSAGQGGDKRLKIEDLASIILKYFVD